MVYNCANQAQEADNLRFENRAGHHRKHHQIDDHPKHPPLNQRRRHQKRPGIHPDHQQPLDDLLDVHGHEAAERELVEEVPEEGTDNRCDGDARKGAEERGRKEVERHGADEGYPREDEVQALLPVSLEEVDVENPNQAIESDHTGENYHPRFTGMGDG